MRSSSLSLAATLLMLAQSPSWAGAPETLKTGPVDLRGAFDALKALSGETRSAMDERRRRAVPERLAAAADRDALPEACESLPVVYIRSGEIFKNGELLGSRANNFRANCDGAVAWADSSGGLHLDAEELASRVNAYDLAWHGDALVWTDSSGVLHKHAGGASKAYDRVSSFTFLRYTGDVVWRDSWGDLHRNESKLGRVSAYKAAERTGDVAWTDSYGDLYRNHVLLGRASEYRIADRTGDVAWKDGYGSLYKGSKAVARNPSAWELREDGVLIWRDSSGHYHYL
ncbi:MAG: hypothetical protein HY924_07465 [Elusimicrobia bacterium]|nr:hypothetical protein [Elusimicrobiota bacterium]